MPRADVWGIGSVEYLSVLELLLMVRSSLLSASYSELYDDDMKRLFPSLVGI